MVVTYHCSHIEQHPETKFQWFPTAISNSKLRYIKQIELSLHLHSFVHMPIVFDMFLPTHLQNTV